MYQFAWGSKGNKISHAIMETPQHTNCAQPKELERHKQNKTRIEKAFWVIY